MFRSITLPVAVFVNRTFRAPVVWMEATPFRRVNVVRISLLVVISKSTGKLQGLLPFVSVKMNGSVGSGFGCLVGGTASANPGVSKIKINPTAVATELATSVS